MKTPDGRLAYLDFGMVRVASGVVCARRLMHVVRVVADASSLQVQGMIMPRTPFPATNHTHHTSMMCVVTSHTL
jgi:hypothetical protein